MYLRHQTRIQGQLKAWSDWSKNNFHIQTQKLGRYAIQKFFHVIKMGALFHKGFEFQVYLEASNRNNLQAFIDLIFQHSHWHRTS